MAPHEGSIGYRLVARAHSPTSAAKLFSEKVQVRPLLLKPSEASSTTPDARTHRRNVRLTTSSKRKKSIKPGPMSAREKRATAIHEIPKEERQYELYKPLHSLWLGYIREILNVNENFRGASTGSAATLVSADYHGAYLEVVRSRCPSRVGIGGIVIKDSKFTFEIITKNNTLKIVPKEHTVFKFEIPVPVAQSSVENADGMGSRQDETPRKLSFELHGDQFQHRAVDRASKKFKPHFLNDL